MSIEQEPVPFYTSDDIRICETKRKVFDSAYFYYGGTEK